MARPILKHSTLIFALTCLAAQSQAWCKRTGYIDDLAVYEDADDGTGFKLDHQNIQTPYGQEGRILNDGVSTKFFFKDHLASTRVVMNDGGAIQEAFEYYSYGNIKNLMVYSRPTREKFTGKEFDEDGKGPGTVGMQLSYFGARYYDADIGLWTSTDPKSEFHSPYSYLGGDPINNIDPDGKYRVRAHVRSEPVFDEDGNKHLKQSTSYEFLASNGINEKILEYVGKLGEQGVILSKVISAFYNFGDWASEKGTTLDNPVKEAALDEKLDISSLEGKFFTPEQTTEKINSFKSVGGDDIRPAEEVEAGAKSKDIGEYMNGEKPEN